MNSVPSTDESSRSLLKPILSDKVWQQIHCLNQNIDNNAIMNYKSSAKPSTKESISTQKTIDDIINWNNIGIKCWFSENFKTSIKAAISISQSQLMFVTDEDQVYCFGNNTHGCLGLGDKTNCFDGPVLNSTLSGKQLIDVCSGFRHCIGLTRNGLCYAWGDNSFGQLGIGSIESQCIPNLVDRLNNEEIVQICCGSNHSMALTSNEEVFAWGQNTFGQLGDSTYKFKTSPIRIYINEPITAISCGKINSLGLSSTGRVYVWGINEHGQLARHRNCDIRVGRDKAVCNTPSLVNGLNCVIKKAVCGPDHTLLLTKDGQVYSFGMNNLGQVGNGSTNDQFEPVCLNNRIKIKDIISNKSNELSLAITEDDRYYVWGSVQYELILRPKSINITDERSVFDIYLKCAKYKVLFQTLVLNQNDHYCFASKESKTVNLKTFSISETKHESIAFNNSDEFIESLFNCIDTSNQSVLSDSNKTSITATIGSESLKNRLNDAFNNPKDSNLKFVSEDKVFYCQKEFLKFRNRKFWQKVKQNITETKVIVDCDKFEVIEAFVKYLYGFEPQLNNTNVLRLQSMATYFGEKELMDHCALYISQLEAIVSTHRKSMLAIDSA